MPEKYRSVSFEERLAACPIHQWADIDNYLERAQVPQNLRRPFHELVLIRGELPKNVSSEQGKQFGKQAMAIIIDHKIQPIDSHALKTIFVQLIEQWLAKEARNN